MFWVRVGTVIVPEKLGALFGGALSRLLCMILKRVFIFFVIFSVGAIMTSPMKPISKA